MLITEATATVAGMSDDSSGGETDEENDAHPPPNVDRSRYRPDRSSTDTLYQLLADDRRRRVLSFLTRNSGEAVSVDRLVDDITEHEWPDPGPASHRERVAIDLHHVHLPKLADAGVIDHDPVDETVRYEGSESITILLDAADDIELDDT